MPRYFHLTPVMGGATHKHPLSEEPQLIGRSERAAINLRDPSVSRRHARIEVINDEVYLEDLASKHGTFVNSKRVKRAQLKVGDLVVFGLAEVLRLEESAEPMPSPRATPTSDLPQDLDDELGLTTTQRDLFSRLPLRSASEVSGAVELVPPLDRALRLTQLGSLTLAVLPGLYARLSKLSSVTSPQGGEQSTTAALQVLREQIEPLVTTVARLVELAMRVAPEAAVNLADVVQSATSQVEELFSTRRVKVSTSIAPGITVRTEPERLATALAGLLINAGNASPEGSQVEISARVTDEGVALQIVDRGYGYTGEALSQVGRPFGLDMDPVAIRLWQARSVVVALGGSLTVRASEGVGGSVSILLPTVEPRL